MLWWTFQYAVRHPPRPKEVNEHAEWTETRMQKLQFSLKVDDVSLLFSFPLLTPDIRKNLQQSRLSGRWTKESGNRKSH